VKPAAAACGGTVGVAPGGTTSTVKVPLASAPYEKDAESIYAASRAVFKNIAFIILHFLER
jgi:hypothetical protein